MKRALHILTLLGFALLEGRMGVSEAAEPREAEKKWSVLTGCQLLPDASNDGDSFHVKHKGEEHIFRLYFVDAPETSASFSERLDDQARSFGLPKSQMIPLGKLAEEFSREFLDNKFSVVTCWEDAKGQSKLPRYFARIKVGTKFLDEALVKEGLVRIYGKNPHIPLPGGLSARGHERVLEHLQNTASKEQKGAWALVATRDLQRVKKDEPTTKTAPDKPTRKPAKVRIAALGDEKLNINTATEEELLALPGIGPKSAMLILKNRPFVTLADVEKVSGFGAKTVAGLTPFLYAAPKEPLPGSGRYVVENGASLRGKTISVSVTAITPAEGGAPNGYKSYSAATVVDGVYGGKVTLFISSALTAQLDGLFADGTPKPVTGVVYEYGDVVGLTVR